LASKLLLIFDTFSYVVITTLIGGKESLDRYDQLISETKRNSMIKANGILFFISYWNVYCGWVALIHMNPALVLYTFVLMYS
jgi:hypothetical protein